MHSTDNTTCSFRSGDGVVLAQAGGFGDAADGAYYSAAVEALAAALSSVVMALGVCDLDDPAMAEHAWQWSLAHGQGVLGDGGPALRGAAWCLPLLLAALTGRSGYGPAVDVVISTTIRGLSARRPSVRFVAQISSNR